jgi:polyisoprenoid-binding protein YceI
MNPITERTKPQIGGHWMTALAKIHAQSAAKMLIALVCLPVLLLLWTADASSQKAIDTERSVLTVRVYKTGLLSALGHEHEIRAPIQKGTFDEGKNTVEFVVVARTLRVLDSDVSEKDRTEIQSTMLGPKVLDSAKFHEIRFHSTDVSRAGEDRWILHGDLTLHGQARPVKVDVKRRDFGSVATEGIRDYAHDCRGRVDQSQGRDSRRVRDRRKVN